MFTFFNTFMDLDNVDSVTPSLINSTKKAVAVSYIIYLFDIND